MIGGMRKFAKSKWALVLLFIPLIVSFGIFGFQDPFSGISGGGLSKIGDRQIYARDVSDELSNELERIRVEEERIVSQADAVREGIAQNVLASVEYRALILAYADKIGVRASQQAVNDLLINRAAGFKDALGRFNLDVVRARADSQKMQLKEFEETIREDLTAGYVTSAAFAAIEVPEILSTPVINFVGESRTLSIAQLNDNTISEPKAPTDAELEAWYNSHKDQFVQPERRRISVLSYSPDDYLDQVELTAEQVRAEYDKQIKTYSTPETREISEFTSSDRNVVQTFIDLTQQGVAVDEALQRANGLTRADRKVVPDDVEDERYRQLVFALPVDKVQTTPVRLSETAPWLTVLVRTITPGTPQPFEEVAEKVRNDLAQPEARRRYEDESERVRDAAGGQPLEEIGKQFGFPVLQLLPIDRNARTLRGDQAQLMVNNPALAELFTLQPGQMTNLFEGDNSRAMYRLDEIVPSYTLTFAEVKDRVFAEYMREQVEAAANKAATDMVAAVKAGQTFQQAATAVKMTALPAVAATRQGNPLVDPQVLNGAFNLKVGEVAMVTGQNRAPWVVRVDKIDAVTPADAAVLRARIAPQVAQSLEGDMREVFVRGLQKEVGIVRDETAIRQYFEALAPAEE